MTRAAWLLLAVGLMQMFGDVFGFEAVRGLGMATAASPAPRVFCSRDGLETFSTRFFLEWDDEEGSVVSVPFSSELAIGLRGPYNRRNVYGAIIAYGPYLATDPKTARMFDQVFGYALGGDAPLLAELGIDTGAMRGAARVRLVPRRGSDAGGRPLVLEVRDDG